MIRNTLNGSFTSWLVAQDHAVGDERAVAVVTGDGNALIRRRRFTARKDVRALLEVDHLDRAVRTRDLQAEGLEVGDRADDHVIAIEAALIPLGLPLTPFWKGRPLGLPVSLLDLLLLVVIC